MPRLMAGGLVTGGGSSGSLLSAVTNLPPSHHPRKDANRLSILLCYDYEKKRDSGWSVSDILSLPFLSLDGLSSALLIPAVKKRIRKEGKDQSLPPAIFLSLSTASIIHSCRREEGSGRKGEREVQKASNRPMKLVPVT